MKRADYNDEYGHLDWDIQIVNQYVFILNIRDEENQVNVTVPTRNSIAGETACLPRDDDFPMKEEANRVIQFETDYLPVKTPEAMVENVDRNGTIEVELEIKN